MSIRINAVNSGNWSDPNTWYAGIMPQENCEVYCNGHYINIDQDINVLLISNEQTYPDVCGGGLDIINNAQITANLICSTEPLIKFSADSLKIFGNIKGSDTTGNISCIENNYTGTLEISGNVIGGFAGYSYGVINCNTGTISVTGTISKGWGGYSSAIFNRQNGKIIINGVESTNSGDYGDNYIYGEYGDQPQF